MAKQIQAKLIEKTQISKDIYKFKIQADEIVKDSKPGNFIEIRVSQNTEPFLRRPISIYNIEQEEGTLEFILQVKGKGTQILSQKKEGEKIDIIGPLGFGTFKIEGYEKLAIIRRRNRNIPTIRTCKTSQKTKQTSTNISRIQK